MSEHLLLQILDKVTKMDDRLDKIETRLDNLEVRLDKVESRLDNLEADQKLIKTQVEQNTQILKAVLDRQEETDAKLEALTLDVHNLHGELKRVEQKVDTNHAETMEELRDIRKDIDFTYQKTALHEKELYKLKNN